MGRTADATQRCNWVGARLPLTFNAVYIQTTVVSFHEIIQLNALVPWSRFALRNRKKKVDDQLLVWEI